MVVIFIVSYASFSFQGSNTTSTLTTTVEVFYPLGYATVNVTPVVYQSSFSLKELCNSGYVTNTLNETLISMEKNGSVSAFYQAINGTINVQSGTLQPGDIYAIIESKLNSTEGSCVQFSGGASVKLPQSAYFSVQGQNIRIPLGSLSLQSMQITYSGRQPTIVTAMIRALIAPNYTIYGNMTLTQLSVH
ncbi:MAG: hypothetical protein QXF41_00390 [Candidatus Micrarchaeaceae archaeon]